MARIKAPHDFNGDGISDVLWRNVNTGEVAIWTVNGKSVESLSLGRVDSDWSVRTWADVNSDLTSDLIWQNANGQINAWYISGARRQDVLVTYGNPGSDVAVVASGYYGGNDYGDILMQSRVTYQASIWTLFGTEVATKEQAGTAPQAGYRARHSGDFDGNGAYDILWRHDAGQPVVWLQALGRTEATSGLGLPNPGTAWDTVGTGDFNADGKTDILWQRNDGPVDIWFMNGTAIGSSVRVGDPGVAWDIVSTGHYNADNYWDILLKNNQNGQVAIWTMEGAKVTESYLIGGSNAGEWVLTF